MSSRRQRLQGDSVFKARSTSKTTRCIVADRTTIRHNVNNVGPLGALRSVAPPVADGPRYRKASVNETNGRSDSATVVVDTTVLLSKTVLSDVFPSADTRLNNNAIARRTFVRIALNDRQAGLHSCHQSRVVHGW